DVVIIRRFRKASRLLLTVATIGLAQVLGGLELLIPRWVGAPSPLNGGYATPVSSIKLHVDPVIITGDHLLIVAVVPVVIAALAWFLLRTDNGVAVRAAAENADRALLLGIPVRSLSTIVWAVAGGLSALTFVLKGPFQGATRRAGPSSRPSAPSLASCATSPRCVPGAGCWADSSSPSASPPPSSTARAP